ncbi:MAG: MaoC family dehydratase [Bacteroidota bacterium]|nr:MaoC family dehydratase [Bacteroidota bacterium]
MEGRRLQDMTVGETAAFTKTVSEADVYGFAGITGDFNPMHVNAVHAAASRFERRIAHGVLSAGLISAVLGMQLPGAGAIYVSQSLRFLAPVYLGDTITAEVEVVELIPERNRVRLATRCRNQDGVIVAEGESVLLPRKA